MSQKFYLAQVNVARFLYPPDALELTDFFGNLALINALADTASASSGVSSAREMTRPTCGQIRRMPSC